MRSPCTLGHHRPHDFQKPRIVSEERIRALDTIHRKFARCASARLSALVRARVTVELSDVSQGTYFDFIRSLPNPTSLCLAFCLPRRPAPPVPGRVPPGPPQRLPLVLEVSPLVLFPMIERLLGGKGDVPAPPSRPLTRIEQGLARSVAEQLLGGLEESWTGAAAAPGGAAGDADSSSFEVHFDLVEMEHNPLLLQVVGPSEPTVVLSFQVALGKAAGAGGPMHLAVPVKPYEPILATLERSVSPGSRPEENSPEEKEKILERLAGSTVELTAELATVPLALPDLLALRPGDVIDTQVTRASEVSLRVDGKKAFLGHPALHDGQRAVRITRADAEG